MQDFAQGVVSIADACLGGLRGSSALLIGPEEQRQRYIVLLQQAEMKRIFQEETSLRISSLLPHVQLLMHLPPPQTLSLPTSFISAASIASGCVRRRTPLLIFDLAESTSIDELAGLLPAVCLYTPEELRQILTPGEVKIS